MKKNKILLLIGVLLISLTSYSQKRVTLSEIYGTEPINIIQPLQTDSINIKGDKFKESDLLGMFIAIPDQAEFKYLMESDTAGLFYPPKPYNEFNLQLFSFYVSTNRYGRGTLKITSPNLIEIYVDGKMISSKTEKDDSLGNAKIISASIKPYPLTNRVIIKFLSSSNDKIPPSFKIEIENEKNDTITEFIVNNSKVRKINFSDMTNGNRVSNVSISPKGNYAIISYKYTKDEKNNYLTELYDIKNDKRFVLDINGAKKQLNWMPSSEKIFYITKAFDKSVLISIDPETLEEKIICENVPSDVSFRFSPDEKTLYYSKFEKVEESKNDLRLLRSVEDRQPGYLDRSFLYKFDLEKGFGQQLTFGTNSSWLTDISPDSRQILISFSEENITERPFRKRTLLLLDLESMKTDTIWSGEGFAGNAIFSPDGKKLLISGSGEAFGGIGLNLNDGQTANSYNRLAFIMNIQDRKIEALTRDFDPSINNFSWNKEDNLIYFTTTDKDYENVYSYNPSDKKFSKLPLKEEVIKTFRTSNNSLNAVYMGVSLSNSTKAYVYDLKSKRSVLIADPYKERLEQLNLGIINDWNFINSDGIEIQGKYYLPPDFDSLKKYPLIVYYYGGTTPTARTFESSYPGHVFAAQDYIVYVVQPSGTIGYGQKFAAMHVNAWGKRTAEDIIEGTIKFVNEHDFVNSEKIGCIGASYGGFMTMYLLTQTDIFAAGTSHAGISSISSYWGEGYWGYSYSSAASANSYPWNNYDLYVKQSPLFNADKINTPLLLTHGLVDTNVPVGESIQMYTALKILGKPVEFIQVKDENHGVSNFKRRMEWNNSIMAWFNKWLKDDSSWWNGLYPDN